MGRDDLRQIPQGQKLVQPPGEFVRVSNDALAVVDRLNGVVTALGSIAVSLSNLDHALVAKLVEQMDRMNDNLGWIGEALDKLCGNAGEKEALRPGGTE